MCRLLYVKSNTKFNVRRYLVPFADMCKNNRVYQGHGWGFSTLTNDGWQHYKNISPIWEDKNYAALKTKLLIAHARSAFEDKDIIVKNNMPFHDSKYVFVFNGELRNVRIKSNGRIGAEKIFNFIKKFDKGEIEEAMEKGIKIIKKRTLNLRGMNIIITDSKSAYAYSTFTKDDDYFTMRYSIDNGRTIICSERININVTWQKVLTNKVLVFK